MRNMEENTVIAEEKKVKEPKTPKQKAFFVLKIVGNVIFYAILLLLFLWSIMNINGGARNQGFPNIFGKGFLNVATDSMSHENMINDIYKQYPEYKDYEIQGIEVGDLIVSKVLNDNDRKNLKVGDVCTFYDKSLNALNTHRLVYITYDNDNVPVLYTFQGDKSVSSFGKYNPQEDPAKATMLLGNNQIQQFAPTDSAIKGLTTSVNAGGGKVLKNLQDNWLWYFVFPVIILLLVEVFLVVRNIMILRGEKNKLALQSDKDTILADEKERLRQELLAEMRAQGLVPPAETNNEAPAVAAVATEEPTENVEEVKTEETTELNSEENKTEEVVEETPAQEEAPAEEKTEEVEPQTEEVTETKEEPQVEEKVEEPETKEEVVEEVKEEAAPQEETPAVEEANEDKETVEEKVEEVKPKKTRKTTKKTDEE